METMKISKEVKELIETNQNQLKAGIRTHQLLTSQLKHDPENHILKRELQNEQQHIIVIGLEQKVILEKLRREYKIYQKNIKINGIKSTIEDKRFNLTNALNRARKQTIISRSTAIPSSAPTLSSRSPSEHSSESPTSTPPTPEPPSLTPPPPPPPAPCPLLPHDVSQSDFLTYFCLATHDVFREMQSRRVERKRRSTANPQFLYTRGWDISKRKRNFYLSNMSPPNTRQSVRNKATGGKADRIPSPPTGGKTTSRPTSPIVVDAHHVAPSAQTALSIPNLPSGLTIERITEGITCIECKLPGNLSICDVCSNGFHISCHNRPLVQTPRHCPNCYSDLLKTRQMAAQSSSSGANTPILEERLVEKNELLGRNKSLTAELNELQAQHSKLTVSLRDQETEKEQLMNRQHCTNDKIQKILSFITTIKAPLPVSIDNDR